MLYMIADMLKKVEGLTECCEGMAALRVGNEVKFMLENNYRHRVRIAMGCLPLRVALLAAEWLDVSVKALPGTLAGMLINAAMEEL